jgi:hypothetical protein
MCSCSVTEVIIFRSELSILSEGDTRRDTKGTSVDDNDAGATVPSLDADRGDFTVEGCSAR